MAQHARAEVLIVERQQAVGRSVAAYLREHGYTAVWVGDGEKAAEHLERHVTDVLVTELRAARVDGLRLMALAKDRNPHVCVVLVAEEGDIEQATQGVCAGAHDFQTKPLNLAKLEGVIQHGLEYQRVALAQVELHRRLDERFGLASIAGSSRQAIRLYNAIREIGPLPCTVLIQGEPGSGKRLVAQALHHNSARRDEPFVTFDCEGLPEVVVRAELFGYAVGRAMGGSPLRQGRFELADGGTLYVDGVDTLSPMLQDRLAEQLESSEVVRPDSGKRVRVDVRFIAASSRRLSGLVAEGAFRAGLYDVLRPVSIDVPPLRERSADIPLLCERFLREAADRQGKEAPALSPEVLDVFKRYPWPGNARELENVLHGMVLGQRSPGALGPRDIPEPVRSAAQPDGGELGARVGMTMSEIERRAIEETLRVCGGDKPACARMLGIGLRTLYRKLKQYEAE